MRYHLDTDFLVHALKPPKPSAAWDLRAGEPPTWRSA
jgi:hypothetical protein